MKTETEKALAGKGSNNPPAGGRRNVAYPRKHQTVVHQTKFNMICIVLKGHIFDSDDSRHANQSNAMLREIAEYIRRTYQYV